jgi:hypothetical protein
MCCKVSDLNGWKRVRRDLICTFGQFGSDLLCYLSTTKLHFVLVPRESRAEAFPAFSGLQICRLGTSLGVADNDLQNELECRVSPFSICTLTWAI